MLRQHQTAAGVAVNTTTAKDVGQGGHSLVLVKFPDLSLTFPGIYRRGTSRPIIQIVTDGEVNI